MASSSVMQARVLPHGGRDRTYAVHVPDSLRKPAPVVAVLHGSGGSGEGIARITGFNAVADAGGFIAVYPDGTQGHWNDGRGLFDTRPHLEGVDDIGFLQALFDAVATEWPADPTRYYVTGASNGAILAYRMALEAPGAVAAIAPVMAPLPENMANEGGESAEGPVPMPVLLIHGTDDPIIPYRGGAVSLRGQYFGRVQSVDDTVWWWVERNGCNPIPQTETVVPRGADGMAVRRDWFTNHCAEVVLYTVDGGGHTWPGGEQYAPEWIIGHTCRRFNASAAIWEFFARHARTGSQTKDAAHS